MARGFQEIECKFLDIDIPLIEQKLIGLGFKKKYKKLFKRYVFDYPDRRLNSDNAWLRVRDEGGQTTMTFKQRTGVGELGADGGMREIEVTVDDFRRAGEILEAIGMEIKFYEENWRTLYERDGVEVSIDEWPLIPAYLEIEASSWGIVDSTATKLGFDPGKKMVCSTMQVYKQYGIREDDYSTLTFEKQEKVPAPVK